MINSESFVKSVIEVHKKTVEYMLGKSCDTVNGTIMCDCIGMVIAALKMLGIKWTGIHGTNYAIRNQMSSIFNITSTSQLEPGMVIYKGRKPGEPGYKLPAKYARGGNSYNGDDTDYYHIGVVVKTNPLTIYHCSTGGMLTDTKLGKWKYAGWLKKVSKEGPHVEPQEPQTQLTAIVTGGMLNLRAAKSRLSTRLDKIPDGSVVYVLSDDGKWCRVTYNGRTGYVMKAFLVI